MLQKVLVCLLCSILAYAQVHGSMVFVEGGTFIMGDGIDSEMLERYVNSFYISKYEVTQVEWVAIMGANPSHFKGDNLPVESIGWLDTIEYCNRRSIVEGLTPAYHGSGDNVTVDMAANGYRLPTEAEWEYAASVGNSYSDIDTMAWYMDNSMHTTHPVGTKAADDLGIYDIAGNVSEWVWDSTQKKPISSQFIKGGAWNQEPSGLRATSLASGPSRWSHKGLGFRVVLTTIG